MQPTTERAVFLLAHTARMQEATRAYIESGRGAAHPKQHEYATTLALYQAEWNAQENDERAVACDDATTIHDMTPELIAAARAALEA